jgi:hypothetical protein
MFSINKIRLIIILNMLSKTTKGVLSIIGASLIQLV